MTGRLSINGGRLLRRIRDLGCIGRDEAGQLTRLAGTDADRLGRDALVTWAREAGLDVRIDRVGNIFGIWWPEHTTADDPLVMGSHIDTVINAGTLDGCYGVLAGLEVIQTLKESRAAPNHPIAVAAFTNEEGVRFNPDMMGSAVFAGAQQLEIALASTDANGSTLGDELRRIGYAGDEAPGFLKPYVYLELHIEQGPILETEGVPIGAVDSLQGISWQRITISGEANHAGTTPMALRQDAGVAAAQLVHFLHSMAATGDLRLVATVGSISLSPGAINVVPGDAMLTVDMRSPDEETLLISERKLATFLESLGREGGFSVAANRLARTQPVRFNEDLVKHIERAAAGRGQGSRRMTSGAGHDAQMLAPLAPTAMIFVPSVKGISHNPAEHTPDDQLIAGANIMLDTVQALVPCSVEQTRA